MDGDPAVEPELDSFSLTLPLPYRVALIIVLGMVSCDKLLPSRYGEQLLMCEQEYGFGAQICIIFQL
jgi:hypothetical protein